MIEEEAVVTKVDGRAIWVEKFHKSACGSCSQGCGTSLVARMMGDNKPVCLRIEADDPLAPGDRVVIGVEEGAMVSGSFIVYLLPLFFLFGGAVLGKLLADQGVFSSVDTGSIAGGLAGLALAFVLLKRYLGFRGPDLRPSFIRRVPR